jgi:hypothetical protein
MTMNNVTQMLERAKRDEVYAEAMKRLEGVEAPSATEGGAA